MEEAPKTPEKPFWHVIRSDGVRHVFEEKDWHREVAGLHDLAEMFVHREEKKEIIFYSPMVVEYVGD